MKKYPHFLRKKIEIWSTLSQHLLPKCCLIYSNIPRNDQKLAIRWYFRCNSRGVIKSVLPRPAELRGVILQLLGTPLNYADEFSNKSSLKIDY